MRPLCKKVMNSFHCRELCAVGDVLSAADIIIDIKDEGRNDIVDAICELARAHFVGLDKERVLVTLEEKGVDFLRKHTNNDTI